MSKRNKAPKKVEAVYVGNVFEPYLVVDVHAVLESMGTKYSKLRRTPDWVLEMAEGVVESGRPLCYIVLAPVKSGTMLIEPGVPAGLAGASLESSGRQDFDSGDADTRQRLLERVIRQPQLNIVSTVAH